MDQTCDLLEKFEGLGGDWGMDDYLRDRLQKYERNREPTETEGLARAGEPHLGARDTDERPAKKRKYKK